MNVKSAIDFKWDNGPDGDEDSVAHAFEGAREFGMCEPQDARLGNTFSCKSIGSDSYIRLPHDAPLRVQHPPRVCVSII